MATITLIPVVWPPLREAVSKVARLARHKLCPSPPLKHNSALQEAYQAIEGELPQAPPQERGGGAPWREERGGIIETTTLLAAAEERAAHIQGQLDEAEGRSLPEVAVTELTEGDAASEAEGRGGGGGSAAIRKFRLEGARREAMAAAEKDTPPCPGPGVEWYQPAECTAG